MTFHTGDRYRILTCSALSGTFGSVETMNLTGFIVVVDYGPDFVDLVIEPDATGIPDTPDLPTETRFWVQGKSFELALPTAARGRIDDYNARGQLVERLGDGKFPAGVSAYAVAPPAGLPSEVYFGRLDVQLASGEHLRKSAKIVLVR